MRIFENDKKDKENLYGIEITDVMRRLEPKKSEEMEKMNQKVINQFYERYPQYKEYDVKLDIKGINNLKRFHDKYDKYSEKKIPSYCLKVEIEKLADEFFSKHPQYYAHFEMSDIFIANKFFAEFPELDDGKNLWTAEDMKEFEKETQDRKKEINEFYRDNKEYIGEVLSKDEMDKITKFYVDFPETKGQRFFPNEIDGFYYEDMLRRGDLNWFYKNYLEYGEEYLNDSKILDVSNMDEAVLHIENGISPCNKLINEVDVLVKIRGIKENVGKKYSKNDPENIKETRKELEDLKKRIGSDGLFVSDNDLDKDINEYILRLENKGCSKKLNKIEKLKIAKNYEKNFLIAIQSKKFRNFKEMYGENITNDRFSEEERKRIVDIEKNLYKVGELYSASELAKAIKDAKKTEQNEEARRLKAVVPVHTLHKQIIRTPMAVVITAYKASRGDTVGHSISSSIKGVSKAFSSNSLKRSLKQIYPNDIIDFINKQAHIIDNERVKNEIMRLKTNRIKYEDNDLFNDYEPDLKQKIIA